VQHLNLKATGGPSQSRHRRGWRHFWLIHHAVSYWLSIAFCVCSHQPANAQAGAQDSASTDSAAYDFLCKHDTRLSIRTLRDVHQAVNWKHQAFSNIFLLENELRNSKEYGIYVKQLAINQLFLTTYLEKGMVNQSSDKCSLSSVETGSVSAIIYSSVTPRLNECSDILDKLLRADEHARVNLADLRSSVITRLIGHKSQAERDNSSESIAFLNIHALDINDESFRSFRVWLELGNSRLRLHLCRAL
jgi:hypothetical protein